MSGIVGHVTYALLAARAARARKLPLVSLIHDHFPSYLAGSYLGCDIQTLPEAVCQDTGLEVGYGTAPLQKSPLTGGPVTPWTFRFHDTVYTPYDVHRMFYGRSHLIFGWNKEERELALPWSHLAAYVADVANDAVEQFAWEERQLAYMLGWATHVVGDCLIKSIVPGIQLELLDGKYTPRNRPIQDLVSFHEVVRNELGLDWSRLLADLVDTPVEPIQLHFMRVAARRGRLAWDFPRRWRPDREGLLRHVLGENRRYQRIRNERLLKRYELHPEPDGPRCDETLSRQCGGLTYTEMVGVAQQAGFRGVLDGIAEQIVDLFEAVLARSPGLAAMPVVDERSTWESLTHQWRA